MKPQFIAIDDQLIFNVDHITGLNFVGLKLRVYFTFRQQQLANYIDTELPNQAAKDKLIETLMGIVAAK